MRDLHMARVVLRLMVAVLVGGSVAGILDVLGVFLGHGAVVGGMKERGGSRVKIPARLLRLSGFPWGVRKHFL